MAYDTKTIAELQQIAANLRGQIALHPNYLLERVELKECEMWIELRRSEIGLEARVYSAHLDAHRIAEDVRRKC